MGVATEACPEATDIRAIDDLADLAAVLRQLRRRHARQRGDSPLTYRELAGRTGWALGVIGDYFAGKALPSTDRLDDLARLLGAGPAEQGALATARDRVEERRRGGGPPPAAPPPAAIAPPAAPVCLLPADVDDFTGMRAELAAVTGWLAMAGRQRATPVVVISGQGGAGKTTLAVHAAHRLREQFPDGQLFLPMRGTHPSPATPEDALNQALRALGVPVQPATLGEKVDLFRQALGGRRMLLVVDDAASTAQVRLLLPGAASCAVLVTARNRLAGLEGAGRVDLAVLPEADALALLDRIAGPERSSAEHAAAVLLVAQCGGLPLAVRIAGARLAARPHLSVAALVQRMGDERHRLDELAVDDLEVRACVSVGYRALDPDTRRLFRLLGYLSPPEFGSWLAALAVDAPPRVAERLLDRLLDARLLDVVSTGAEPPRYRMHELTRLYARECAEQEEPAPREAVRRIVGGLARAVERVAGPLPPGAGRPRWTPLPPLPAAVAELLAEREPRDWLEREETMLVAAVRRATVLDLAGPAWALADLLAYASPGAWRRRGALPLPLAPPPVSRTVGGVSTSRGKETRTWPTRSRQAYSRRTTAPRS
jgi:hypothetical protein